MTGNSRPWEQAWAEALYGPGGLYRTPGAAAQHFRTSVMASRRLAAAVHRLAAAIDAALGHPDGFTVVDLGAGDGSLATELRRLADPRWDVVAVDVAGRPAGVPIEVRWADRLPAPLTGLVVAHEWLDDLPVPVLARDRDAAAGNGEPDSATVRTVLVDDAGREGLGPVAAAADVAWALRWWPDGDRVEVGRSRDEAWADVIRALDRGAALAIDYAHTLGNRPAGGTLTGYRDGRQVAPVPDGRTNLTAHVALDAVAEAGRRAGAQATWTATQRAALGVLLDPAPRPDLALASRDPRGYLRALAARGEDAELRDPAGLGGFGWLVQTRRMDVPRLLADRGR